MPRGGTTKDENHSPPREGRRGGLSRTIGPTPKADAFCPSPEGIFSGDSKTGLVWHLSARIRQPCFRLPTGVLTDLEF